MSKNTKRISVNKFETAIDTDNTIVTTLVGTEDVEIQIKKIISLSDMMKFVRDVVDSCVDGESGEYIPEAYDFAIRIAVLTYYANFEMPSNLEKRYFIVYNTPAFEQVLNSINRCQFNNIIEAINRKIKYRLDIMTSTAAAKIHEIIDKLSDVAEDAENAFKGVSAQEIANFVDGISKLKDIKDEDIAKAIVEVQDKDSE